MDWTQIITAALTLLGVWIMNSKQLAVIQEQINQLRSEQQKHNKVIERRTNWKRRRRYMRLS